MKIFLYIGNDNLLELNGLFNRGDSQYLNAATVTVTLKDANDQNVSGQVWPTTMQYVTASNGNYQAVLEDGLSLTENALYTAVVDADGGADKKGHWELECQARVRRE